MPQSESEVYYKPGSIRRVKLKNFLTYNAVEFRPGPRLNVVIGPNGTGKSTILCAICLGLGGQPPLLGRADDARTFIMHEKNVAEIEVELAPHKKKTPSQDPHSNTPNVHILRRVIDRNRGSEKGRGKGASTYFINNEQVNLKAVETLVQQTYSIAIDNLCTFLPQDRVGSFSGFDSKMLLAETQKSLSGSQHLYTTHMRLIELEEEIRSSGSNLASLEEKLARLKEDHTRLQREKDLIEERDLYIQKVKLLQQKIAWVVFDHAREYAKNLKDEKKIIKDQLNKSRKAFAPLEEHLSQIQHQIQRIHSRTIAFDKSIKESRKKYEAGMTKAERYGDEIESETATITSIDSLHRRAVEKVKVQETKLQETQQHLANYPAQEQLDAIHREAQENLRSLKREMDKARRDLQEKQMYLRQAKDTAQTLKSKYTRMQDDRARRTEHIFRHDTRLQQTYQWIDQNRKMFRRPIHGPIVCHIDPKSANLAAYLEQHVPISVLKAYVVESKEDYDLLYREVRVKLKLPINIITVRNGILDQIRRDYSDDKMDTLKSLHGVLGYLDEGFVCPDPILQALRDRASVHKVLVGTAKTQDSLDNKGLFKYLSQTEDGSGTLKGSCIFAAKKNASYKYTTSVSRYRKETFMRIDEISGARLLSLGISPEKKGQAEKEFQDAEQEMERLDKKVLESSEEYTKIQQKGQELSQKAKDARKAISELTDVVKKIDFAKRKLKEAQEEASKDNEAEKHRHMAKLKNNVQSYISSLESASKSYDDWMKATCSLTGIKMTEEGLVDKSRKIQDAITEKKAENSRLEDTFKNITEEFNRKRAEVKDLQEKAHQLGPIKDADGNELPLKAELDELPHDHHELEEALDDANDKVNTIHDNPQVLQQYEESIKEIETTTQNLEGLSSAEDIKRQELRNLLDGWEAALVNMTKDVNERFGRYMSEMSMAGEIKISTGEDESTSRKGNNNNKEDEDLFNFKDWGIQIKVKFREKSDLQVLSAQVHSGGERSVSTIMYLMALQNMMVSPFRCVDEINQGLDERNERLVFKRIVENSTTPPLDKCGQYFLITPKLLPNLTDMENEDVTIHCIFNGPYNLKHFDDWATERFLRKRKGNDFIPESGEDGKKESLGTITSSHKKKRMLRD